MECGDVTPLLFLSLAWQRAQKKNRKKQERNKSGVTSPLSIKSATSTRVRPANINRRMPNDPASTRHSDNPGTFASRRIGTIGSTMNAGGTSNATGPITTNAVQHR